MTNDKLAFDVPEVAVMIGMSKTGVWNAIRAGLIPVRRVGRRVLVSRQALERFLDSGHTVEKE